MSVAMAMMFQTLKLSWLEVKMCVINAEVCHRENNSPLPVDTASSAAKIFDIALRI